MARSLRSRTTAVSAAVLLLLASTGCNGGSEPEAGPTASASGPSESSSPSASTSESPSDEPTPSATVAKATGPLMKLDGIQMNAPAGWKQLPDIVRFATESNPPSGIGAARIGSLEFPGDGGTLDSQAKVAGKSSTAGKTKRQPDVEIAGVPFFHFAGEIGDYRYYEEFGAISHGYQVTISFDLDPQLSTAEKRKIVDESVATFAWQ